MSLELPQEVLESLAALGIELPEGDPRKALAVIGAALSKARKALPKRPPVRFETRGDGDEAETVLRVQRGGKGAPLVVNRHAAILLVEQLDALVLFSETGESQDLLEQEAQEEEPEVSEETEEA